MTSEGPAHRVESAQVEYGFPKGHLGHLNDSEETALGQFKALVQDRGIFPPRTTQEGKPYGTDDDAMLLRFLRARRFQVQDAYTQLKETIDWRDANELNTLYDTIDLKDYEETRRLYPQWTGRRDKRGIPVYVYEIKHLNSKTMAAYEKSAAKTSTKAKNDGKTPAKLLRLFALYENLTRFALPLATVLADRDNPTTPITQSNNIVDVSGVGFKQFWNLRQHMQDASTLATAHYPETLDRIFIIGAPSFFPTVWGWVKRWFDPITVSKTFILSAAEQSNVLNQFIDLANIPKKYGGQLEFQFGDQPVLDPAFDKQASWSNGYSDFPQGPMYWVDKGDYIECKAVGTDEKQRHETVVTIKKQIFGSEIDDQMPRTKPVQRDQTSTTTSLPSKSQDSISTQQDQQDLRDDNMTNTAPTQARGQTIVKPLEPAEQLGEEIHKQESDTHTYDRVVQDGEVIPATRPAPKTFHTAYEGLTHEDKSYAVSPVTTPVENTGVHNTRIADLIDPNTDTHTYSVPQNVDTSSIPITANTPVKERTSLKDKVKNVVSS